mmetsp:Transcript_11213/g.18645  ORF Transcript_11213/g.18645 Transcript_11213/m.18645 type:complete len:223 (-) Transcript_11213:669-1337(-)
MRKDVYERVLAFSKTDECANLGEYEAHFVKASLKDFERAGLALSSGDGEKLKSLLEKDAGICSEYGTNLGSDKTKLLFDPKDLEGCGDDFIKERLVSRLDLTIHGTDPPKDAAGLQDLVDELRPKICLIANPPGNNMLRTFGHLMNQYSASYYGYMWAEDLSADMFATRFEKEGVMNPLTGKDYRKLVLAPGGTHNINDHLTTFLGQAPSDEAFLKSRGIIG